MFGPDKCGMDNKVGTTVYQGSPFFPSFFVAECVCVRALFLCVYFNMNESIAFGIGEIVHS